MPPSLRAFALVVILALVPAHLLAAPEDQAASLSGAALAAGGNGASAAGPAAGNATEGEPDHRLQQLRIESDGSSFRLFVPVTVPFADFSLDSPPRIILDLDQTTSYLPKAPGLYQVRLDRGPVVSLRTSQYRYSPLDHRVRLSLELSHVVPYEVRRVNGGIELRIPDAAPHSPRVLLVGPSGVNALEDDASPAAKPSDKDRAVAPVKPAPAPTSPAAPASSDADRSKPPSPPASSAADPTTGKGSDEVSQFRTLREALAAAVGSLNVHALDPEHPDEVLHKSGGEECAPGQPASVSEAAGDPAATRVPSSSSGSGTADAGASAAENEYYETPPAYTLPPSRNTAASTAAADDPEAGEESRSGAPASLKSSGSGPGREPAAPVTEGPTGREGDPVLVPVPPESPQPSEQPARAPADTPDTPDTPPAAASAASGSSLPPAHPVAPDAMARSYIVPGDPKETAAARLLHMATQAILAGDESKAEKAAERAHHYYATTGAGEQATLLLRELLVLEGKEIEADALGSLGGPPDTSRIGQAVFLRLVRRYEEKSQLMEVDRLLREWAPAYGPVAPLNSLHLALGEALLRAKRGDLAKTHLEMIPPGDPSEPRAVILLAQAEEETGSKEKALELYQHLAQLPSGPYQVRGLVRSADLEFQLGRTAEALEAYGKFLEGKPPADEEPWALYQVANCHLILGDPGQAKVGYEAVVGRWPGSTWAGFAQDQLEEMKWRAGLASKNTSQKNSSTSR